MSIVSQGKTWVTEKTGKLRQTWAEMEKNRKITTIATIIVIVLAIGISLYFLTKKDYKVLYTDMEATEAGEIYNNLKEAGTDVKLDGTKIYVEASKVDEVKLQLSAQGYPKTGLSYDIFNNASSFGTTDMEKQVTLKFQLEQNVAQTIKRLGKVKNATVMLTLASESQFALSGQNGTPASASIVLDLAAGDGLTKGEATSIRNLVATSIPNLKHENITIVDSNMKMYNADDADTTEINGEQVTLQQQTQKNLEQQIITLLTPVFGQNKVSTSVNVVLNFDKRVTTSVVFEPPIEGEEQGLIVSMKELSETINGGTGAGGDVGVDPNGGTTTYPTVTGEGDGAYYKTTREFNAEINETKDQIEHAKGKIQNLSISVIIDGDEQSVNDQVIAQVSDLVSKAIGVEPANVSVARMAFKGNQEQAEAMAQREKEAQTQQLMRTLGTWAIPVVILLALGAIWFIHARKNKKEKDLQNQMESELMQKSGLSGVNLLADEDISIEDLGKERESESAEKIYKLVQNNPAAVAQLLRNWLEDEYGR